MSPALAGGFLTTEPPGSPSFAFCNFLEYGFLNNFSLWLVESDVCGTGRNGGLT